MCRKLNVNRNTIHKALVSMGLPITRRPPLPEQKVLELLEKSVGFRTIGKTLGVSQRSVTEFARAHGYGCPRKQLSAAQLAHLIGDILDRTASAAALAKKHNASYKLVLELAHRLLKCERFLPSWRTPLSSYLPSRAPRPIKEQHDHAPDTFVRLVAKMCDLCFEGSLPAVTDVEFVHAMMSGLEGACLQGQPEPVLTNFAAGLREAVDMLRTAESGWKN
jgi:hypothetical protein